jgi:hypothetical protein
MTYRRKKQAAHTKRYYEQFCRDNADLLARIGIPPFIMDDHDHFIYYLEHGVPRSDAPMSFHVPIADGEEKYELLKQLIERYNTAGFSNGF